LSVFIKKRKKEKAQPLSAASGQSTKSKQIC